MPDWSQVPIWVIAVVVILKVVFDFLEKWRGKKDEGSNNNNAGREDFSAADRKLAVMIKKVETIERKTDDLHKWHDQRDRDGRFVWYVHGSLEEAIDRLSTSIDRQTDVLSEVLRETKSTGERVSRISQDLPRLLERRDSGVNR